MNTINKILEYLIPKTLELNHIHIPGEIKIIDTNN